MVTVGVHTPTPSCTVYVMDKDTDQWEAGRLIEEAREQRGMSKRHAARAIGMSESWWRKMEMGYQVRHGEIETIRPAPESIAKAAHLVGLNPTRVLRLGGYTDGPAAELPTMREGLVELVENLADEQLPVAQAYLQGLRDGMSQR